MENKWRNTYTFVSVVGLVYPELNGAKDNLGCYYVNNNKADDKKCYNGIYMLISNPKTKTRFFV